MKKIESNNTSTPEHSLKFRVWPGIIIVLIQWFLRFIFPELVPGDNAVMIGVLGVALGGIALSAWWLFFSRVPLLDRWVAFVFIIVSLIIVSGFIDISIATANMGMMFTIYSIPVMCMAVVIWTLISRNSTRVMQRISLTITIIVASGFWLFLRTNGMTSDLHNDFDWRWRKTSEEKFLNQVSHESLTAPELNKTNANWPGFRGINRDGIIHGTRIKTDWIKYPPVILWRQQVGPGCSSFAVQDGLLYTQEQRGENEVVSCYNLLTGKPVWMHNDKARFWDSHAGAGPRGTPTYHNGRIYTFGATGILNALDALTGKTIWTRNAATDTHTKDSGWGFTSSPLIVDSLVIIAATGTLAAYDIYTGQPKWYGPNGAKGYSSPHFLNLQGTRQIVLMSDMGITSLDPQNGKLLWKYEWQTDDRILQPSVTSDSDLIVNGGLQSGLKRLSVKHEADRWQVKERWSTSDLKPYFNDFVINKDYAFGFNGRSLACIDNKTGKRMWQGGHYGGQILLLNDQELLLVLSEKGDLVLVSAKPDQYKEFSSFMAITGKTWNHPVLAGNILIVRNGEEMAAFKLPTENI
jgi:outer membrane protein assembly factor BamB